MSTLAEIFINYNAALEAADYIDSLADNMQNITDDEFNSVITAMESQWTGDNAEAFYAKAAGHSEKMNSASQNLRKIAASIRTIAKRWYDTEMANISISC